MNGHCSADHKSTKTCNNLRFKDLPLLHGAFPKFVRAEHVPLLVYECRAEELESINALLPRNEVLCIRDKRPLMF